MNPSLEVNRDQLVEAFAFLNHSFKPIARKRKRRETATLILQYKDGALTLDLEGTSFTVDASGSWSGTATVPAMILKSFSIIEPTEDPVRLWVADGKLHYESTSIACEWNG